MKERDDPAEMLEILLQNQEMSDLIEEIYDMIDCFAKNNMSSLLLISKIHNKINEFYKNEDNIQSLSKRQNIF